MSKNSSIGSPATSLLALWLRGLDQRKSPAPVSMSAATGFGAT